MASGHELTPSPTPRVGRLDSLLAVRRELARVYRDARRGQVPTQDAARLAFILATIGKLIEGSELAQKIEKLEVFCESISRQQGR
jgi:hypothetical protein